MIPPAVALALGLVVAWSVLTVAMRATLNGFGFEPWSLALTIQVMGGAALLFAAGIRSLPLDPIRRWATWVIGGLRVLTTCCFTNALLHASAGQVSQLTTINVLLATAGALLLFGRRRRRAEWPGFLVIACGLVLLISRLDGGLLNPAVAFVLFSESSVVVASLLAEKHPDNLGTRRQRLALTGFVTLLSALGLLLAWAVLGLMPAMPVGPSAADVAATLSSPWLWLMAFVLGALIRGPATYVAFDITARLGADGYMLGMSAMPLLVMALEPAAASFGLLPPLHTTAADFAVAAVILAGGAWVIVARNRR